MKNLFSNFVADESGATAIEYALLDILRLGAARAGDEGPRAEVVATDIRVIAIGRNVQELPGPDRAVQGTNVTLEVTPEQAQELAVANQSGGLSLVLRSLVDRGVAPALARGNGVSVIRFGVESQLGKMSGSR